MASYNYEWAEGRIKNRIGEYFAVDCSLDYQPFERQTHLYPGCPESMTLESAWLGEFDLMDFLTSEQIKEIESCALEQHTNDVLAEHDEAADHRRQQMLDNKMEGFCDD